MCTHGHSQAEQENTQKNCKLLPVSEKLVWPIVHNSGHKTLNSTKLTVNTQDKEHHKENKSPNGRSWQVKNLEARRDGKN
jgi:hypothetical protein